MPVVLLLALAAYLTVQFSNNLRDNRMLIVRTYNIIDAAQDVLNAIQSAETGQRGYILTQRKTYLAPFDEARKALPDHLARLSDLVAGDPAQQRRIGMLDLLIKQKMQELQATIDVANNQSFEAAREVVLTDSGKTSMDGIRSIIAEMSTDESNGIEAKLQSSDESQRRILIVAVGGSVLGLLAVLIGAFVLMLSNLRLRRAERGLERQSVILQATLDNIRDGIAFFNSSGRLAAFNRNFFALLDLPADLAVPGTTLKALHAAEAGKSHRALDDLPTVPAPSGAPPVPIQIAVGAREVEVVRDVLADGSLLVSCEDVTRRNRAEGIIRQSQKLEAIGHLTGGVAHDFNNLLQVIGSNLDLLSQNFKGDERVSRRLQAAIAGTERGARLTRQLLAFARRQPLDPKPIDLGRLVRGMTDLLKRSLGERIEIETVVAAGLWTALADVSQVENAVLNLGINARDAMPDGGRLTIEVANAFLDEAYAAEHLEVQPGQYVMLAISDTGTGMAPEVTMRAFEPFFTTKAEGAGTGLGLSQVYGYVKQSGGHVKIYSEPGHGTTVKLYLPRSKLAEAVEVGPLSRVEHGDGETILVVEDDAAVRSGVVDMLTGLGYRALQAENADSALAVLASSTTVDLLFTDVVMPGQLKTRDFVREAQTRLPNMAVLYTSGYTENAIIHDGRLDEGVLLLSKPYRQDDLARKIRTALGKRPVAASRQQNGPSAPPAPLGSGQSASPAPPQPRRVTVLVVEDDALIRLSTGEFLRDCGYEVLEAGHGEAALGLLASHDVAVLLTDYGLPGMNGGELLQQARARKPGLPAILITGRSREAIEASGLLSDQVLVLEKPYELEALRHMIERLLNSPKDA
jgi:signal transduction histidine kinase/CheY-like chemotaxis protein